MKKILVTMLVTLSFFLISCTPCEDKKLNNQKEASSENSQNFASSLSYKISHWTRSSPKWPEKTNEETVWNNSMDFSMLQTGYGIKYFNDLFTELLSRVRTATIEGKIRRHLIYTDEDINALQGGIRVYEELSKIKSEGMHREALIDFYLNTGTKFKNTSRGLFWAHKDAEYGGSLGMLRLAYAYASGEGVIIDSEESIKWILLAHYSGSSHQGWAREILKELEQSCSPEKNAFLEIKPKALEKAKEWMQKYPDAFFLPPSL